MTSATHCHLPLTVNRLPGHTVFLHKLIHDMSWARGFIIIIRIIPSTSKNIETLREVGVSSLNGPVPETPVREINTLYQLLLRIHESIDRAETVRVVGTPKDAGEGDRGVVNDDSEL
jgi:hypothetical protein